LLLLLLLLLLSVSRFKTQSGKPSHFYSRMKGSHNGHCAVVAVKLILMPAVPDGFLQAAAGHAGVVVETHEDLAHL
jgi:hypothetical protein